MQGIISLLKMSLVVPLLLGKVSLQSRDCKSYSLSLVFRVLHDLSICQFSIQFLTVQIPYERKVLQKSNFFKMCNAFVIEMLLKIFTLKFNLLDCLDLNFSFIIYKHTLFIEFCFIVPYIYCFFFFFFFLTNCRFVETTSSNSIKSFFSTAFGHFVFQCHISGMLIIFQMS